jgi:hypothetical protein
LRLVLQLGDAFEAGFELHTSVDRFEHDRRIVASFDPALRQKANGKVHRRGALVKQKERWNVDCAAGEVDARRR